MTELQAEEKFSKRTTTPSGENCYRMFCEGTCQDYVSTTAVVTPTVCPICASALITGITLQEPMASSVSPDGTKWDMFVPNEGTPIFARRG